MASTIDIITALLLLSVAICRFRDARRAARSKDQTAGRDFTGSIAKAVLGVMAVLLVAVIAIGRNGKELGTAFWVLLGPVASALFLVAVGAVFASYRALRRFALARLPGRGKWIVLLDLVLVASLLSIGGVEIPLRVLIVQVILGLGAALFLLDRLASWARDREGSQAAELFAALPEDVQTNPGIERARVAILVAERILPARLAREELGDAFERAVALARAGAPGWRIDGVWISAIAIAVGNALRELPRTVFRMRPRA